MFKSNYELDELDYIELDIDEVRSNLASEKIVTADLVTADMSQESSSLSYLFAGYVKDGIVYGARTVGGCMAAVVVAPRVLPYVLAYAIPATSSTAVMVNTATASVSVLSFGFGSKVASGAAEAAWNLSSLGISSAINYMYSARPVFDRNSHHQSDAKLSLIPRNKFE